MCGRYVSVARRAELQALYEATSPAEEPEELAPSWNVAPTQRVYTVVEQQEKGQPRSHRQLRVLRWGLIPVWAKDPKIGSKLINARVETLAAKPSFRSAFAKRRAVVPSAGYYEWLPVEDEDGKTRKQPYFIHPADGGVLSFAGLYERWTDPTKDADDPTRVVWTVTIITTDATGPAGDVHPRTPLILPADRITAWLDPNLTDPEQVQKLLAGVSVEPLEVRPVGPAVNRVQNNGPELVHPLPEQADQPLLLALD